jgi:hypothetical protein
MGAGDFESQLRRLRLTTAEITYRMQDFRDSKPGSWHPHSCATSEPNGAFTDRRPTKPAKFT